MPGPLHPINVLLPSTYHASRLTVEKYPILEMCFLHCSQVKQQEMGKKKTEQMKKEFVTFSALIPVVTDAGHFRYIFFLFLQKIPEGSLKKQHHNSAINLHM